MKQATWESQLGWQDLCEESTRVLRFPCAVVVRDVTQRSWNSWEQRGSGCCTPSPTWRGWKGGAENREGWWYCDWGQALAGRMDGWRWRACGWVREFASCFPELCRGSLRAAAAAINAVADVVGCDWCSHRGEGKPEAEDFGVGPCCERGSTCWYTRKAGVRFAGLPSFSPWYSS